MNRACLSCGLPQASGARCAACSRAKRAVDRSYRANARNAARRARGRLAAAGAAACNACGLIFAASALEVDHIVALADGGLDADENLQLLCLRCHRAKSSNENARRRSFLGGAPGERGENGPS